MRVARVRVPRGADVDLEAFRRIAERYGYRVEVVEEPGLGRVLVELDGMVLPGTDAAARHLAWEHLKKVLGKRG